MLLELEYCANGDRHNYGAGAENNKKHGYNARQVFAHGPMLPIIRSWQLASLGGVVQHFNDLVGGVL